MGKNISFFLWRRNETVWWYSGYKSAYRCRGLRFNPGSGKIPHAVEQLNPCATTIEPTLQSLCFTAREATAMRNPCISTKSSPHLVQIEKARVHQQRPSATKKKKKKKKQGDCVRQYHRLLTWSQGTLSIELESSVNLLVWAVSMVWLLGQRCANALCILDFFPTIPGTKLISERFFNSSAALLLLNLKQGYF